MAALAAGASRCEGSVECGRESAVVRRPPTVLPSRVFPRHRVCGRLLPRAASPSELDIRDRKLYQRDRWRRALDLLKLPLGAAGIPLPGRFPGPKGRLRWRASSTFARCRYSLGWGCHDGGSNSSPSVVLNNFLVQFYED